MDRRERLNDVEESLRAAMDGRQASIWTAMPGVIQSFDATKQTCVVQPTVQGTISAKDGSISVVTMPLCLDCPVQFPGGGGVTLTFPVKKDDECLLVFASRCIDSWWQQGGIQPPAEFRMHDLSDGFAILGFRSVPRQLDPAADTSVAQLRSDDGSTFVELDPDGQVVTITAPGGLTINADTTMNGTLHVTDAVTADSTIDADGDVTGQGTSLHTHRHGGVTTGAGTTGAPT